MASTPGSVDPDPVPVPVPAPDVAPGPVPLRCSYVLPLRRWRAEPDPDLAAYLRDLVAIADDVLVVDGSDPDIFRDHGAWMPPEVRHVPVDPRRSGPVGKVDGVLTGVDLARHELVVIADDDVRYDRTTLAAVVERLQRAHLVRPQNVFDPLPWHARWDTARSLLNRSVSTDHPGTLAVRRSALLATGGYSDEVLFENLELVRTIAAAGGVVAEAPDVYVRRVPCTTAHFLGQRRRQAYDSFATPARLVAELAVVPTVCWIGYRSRRSLPVAVVAAVAAAELGRRRHGGRAAFPPSCSLFAPLWLLERGVCSWLALWQRLVGGGASWGGVRLPSAATPARTLRRRLSACRPLPPPLPVGGDPDRDPGDG